MVMPTTLLTMLSHSSVKDYKRGIIVLLLRLHNVQLYTIHSVSAAVEVTRLHYTYPAYLFLFVTSPCSVLMLPHIIATIKGTRAAVRYPRYFPS